jgi:hypothetical protein
MDWGHTHRLWNVHNLQVGLVTKVVHLGPEDRDASSGLHEAQFLPSVDSTTANGLSIMGQRIQEDDLLRLVEV